MVPYLQVVIYMNVNLLILQIVNSVESMTICHIFFYKCPRLSVLFQLMQKLIKYMLPTIDKIPFYWFIVGIPSYILGVNRFSNNLANWSICVAKMSIVRSRFNKFKNEGTTCVLTLFKASILARLNVERAYAFHSNTVNMFFF